MKKISIKDHISIFAQIRFYFHLQDLQKYFNKNNIEYNEENLKKSILRLKKNNIIYGAGRGWYSTIVEKFVLHSEPIEKIIKIISEKFLMIRNKTIILRSAIHYRKPKNQYLAKIEKIIVDLFMEVKKVNLIDFEEYKKIVTNIILSNRVNIAEILDYAHSRKI